MPPNFGSTPYSSETLPANTFPVSAVFVPNTANGNLTAMQGGPSSTDSNGYTSAPGAIYIADGNDVTQGTSTDAANANSVIGQLKQIKTNTASVTIGSLPAISGTVTANQGGSWTVTANAGSNLNTSALALDTSINGVLVAQGSSTSGEHGPLVQGAVTTGSPSYTTAQTSPLSLTTAGALRVDGSAVVQPVSGTFWQATQPVSAASLPLPTGAATATKQPALGTAGTASSDVLTVQGIASMTALKVDGSGVTQPVSGTFWQATQPVSGTVTANAGSGTFTVSGTVTANQGGAPWAENITQFGGTNISTGIGASGTGIPRVTVSNDSNVLATQSGTWTVQPGNTPNTSAWLVQDVAGTSGGSTPSHTMSAASTNATSLKASAGMVYGLSISNVNASARYFKLYNKASSPTVGTDTPVLTLQVPGSGTVIRAYPIGLALSTGIAWACTGGIADSDTTTIGANDCSIDIDYK